MIRYDKPSRSGDVTGVSLRLPSIHANALAEVASEHGVSRSQIVREAVGMYLLMNGIIDENEYLGSRPPREQQELPYDFKGLIKSTEPQTRSYSFRCQESDIENIKRLGAEHDMSGAEVTRDALRIYFDLMAGKLPPDIERFVPGALVLNPYPATLVQDMIDFGVYRSPTEAVNGVMMMAFKTDIKKISKVMKNARAVSSDGKE